MFKSVFHTLRTGAALTVLGLLLANPGLGQSIVLKHFTVTSIAETIHAAVAVAFSDAKKAGTRDMVGSHYVIRTCGAHPTVLTKGIKAWATAAIAAGQFAGLGQTNILLLRRIPGEDETSLFFECWRIAGKVVLCVLVGVGALMLLTLILCAADAAADRRHFGCDLTPQEARPTPSGPW
jgi:hypothetical protein